MQTPTITVQGGRQYIALVTAAPSRPAHDYTYGASRESLRPVVTK